MGAAAFGWRTEAEGAGPEGWAAKNQTREQEQNHVPTASPFTKNRITCRPELSANSTQHLIHAAVDTTIPTPVAPIRRGGVS